MSNLLHSISALAQRTPTQVALKIHEKSLSYQSLFNQILEFSSKLIPYKGQCVALELSNSFDWIIADLACLHAGVVCVPIPPFFHPSQKAHLMKSAGIQLLVKEELQLQPLNMPLVSIPANTVKITFTSGSTGSPKGVCLSLSHIESVVSSLSDRIGREVSMQALAVLPLSVLLENLAGCYTTLYTGNTYHVPILSTHEHVDYIKKHQITSTIFVPEILDNLLTSKSLKPMSSLRFVAVGGAKVSTEMLHRAQMEGIPVFEGYGLSECASVISVNSFNEHRLGSVGKVLPHVNINIAEDGEIIIKNTPFIGYLDKKKYLGNDYPTGDIGYIENDYLYITGRKKNIIILSNGRNISPEWIEHELNNHKHIKNSIVYGESNSHLSALLVLNPQSLPKEISKTVIQEINAKLPNYAQINTWHIIEDFSSDPEVFTTNGKMIRSKIIEKYQYLIN